MHQERWEGALDPVFTLDGRRWKAQTARAQSHTQSGNFAGDKGVFIYYPTPPLPSVVRAVFLLASCVHSGLARMCGSHVGSTMCTPPQGALAALRVGLVPLRVWNPQA